MALYDDEVVSEVVTEFGKGRSLTIKIREDAMGLPDFRKMAHKQREVSSAAKRIESLSNQQAKASTREEWAKLQEQIEYWQSLPDEVSLCVELLLMVGEGWDYYPNKEAEEQGQPYEYTRENIARIKPMLLMKVINNINSALGFMEDDEAKKSNVSLPEPSSPAVTEVGSSPNGISSSTMTAQ